MLYTIQLWQINNVKNTKLLFDKSCKTKTTKNKYYVQALKLFKQIKAENYHQRLAIDIKANNKIVGFLEM